MYSERPFRSVYFDCDSTLSSIEGIEHLAGNRDQDIRDRLVELTNASMQGKIPLENVYGARLDLVRPTRSEVAAIGELYIAHLTPDADSVVAALHSLGKHVAIISGGLRPPVQELARHLGIEEVHAVGIEFAADGAYESFDRTSPLARGGGKIEVLAEIGEDRRPLCLIGDGATDLEASRVTERFVGFGGVAVREVVEREARHFIRENTLAPLLSIILTPAEFDELRANRAFTELVARCRR